MDPKPRFAAEEILTIGRCSFPSSSRGPAQRAVMSQPMIDEHCVSAASFRTLSWGTPVGYIGYVRASSVSNKCTPVWTGKAGCAAFLLSSIKLRPQF